MSTAVNIIKILSRADQPISGTELSKQLGVSRNAVWKQIENLRSNGYEIEARQNLGYRLISTPEQLDKVALQAKLETRTLGQKILVYEQVESTNDIAKDQAKQDAAEGLVVIAKEQTIGRGRRGRTWFSHTGGLYFSILLRPKLALSDVSQITLLAGITIVEVLREHYGLPAMLKWPNDVLIDGKKVCGILTELSADPESVQYVVVGIGINSNQSTQDWPEEITNLATSIRINTGKNVSHTQLLYQILTAFEANYNCFIVQQYPVIMTAKKYSPLLGQQVQIITQDETYLATAVDLDPSGALIIADQNGKKSTIWAADVSLRMDKE